jgi:hypothetical protein
VGEGKQEEEEDDEVMGEGKQEEETKATRGFPTPPPPSESSSDSSDGEQLLLSRAGDTEAMIGYPAAIRSSSIQWRRAGGDHQRPPPYTRPGHC